MSVCDHFDLIGRLLERSIDFLLEPPANAHSCFSLRFSPLQKGDDFISHWNGTHTSSDRYDDRCSQLPLLGHPFCSPSSREGEIAELHISTLVAEPPSSMNRSCCIRNLSVFVRLEFFEPHKEADHEVRRGSN